MTMLVLYVNDRLVDITPETKVIYNYSLHSAENMYEYKSGYSFTFSLPRTYNNDVIFGNIADSMANVWTTQYDGKINFGSGYLSGKIIISSFDAKHYNCSFSDAIGYAFSALKNLKLKDTRFYVGDTETSVDYICKKETIIEAWTALANATANKWSVLNFIPAYNGTKLSDNFKPGNQIGGVLTKECNEWEVGELRSYFQRPCLSVDGIFTATKKYLSSLGVTLNTPAMPSNLWYILPMIDCSEKTTNDRSNSFYVQTSESEYEDIYPNFAKEAKVSIPVVPILKSITGDSQLSSVPHIWGLSYYGEDSSYYIKCGACQFEAYDATGTLLGRSRLYLFTNTTVNGQTLIESQVGNILSGHQGDFSLSEGLAFIQGSTPYYERNDNGEYVWKGDTATIEFKALRAKRIRIRYGLIGNGCVVSASEAYRDSAYVQDATYRLTNTEPEVMEDIYYALDTKTEGYFTEKEANQSLIFGDKMTLGGVFLDICKLYHIRYYIDFTDASINGVFDADFIGLTETVIDLEDASFASILTANTIKVSTKEQGDYSFKSERTITTGRKDITTEKELLSLTHTMSAIQNTQISAMYPAENKYMDAHSKLWLCKEGKPTDGCCLVKYVGVFSTPYKVSDYTDEIRTNFSTGDCWLNNNGTLCERVPNFKRYDGNIYLDIALPSTYDINDKILGKSTLYDLNINEPIERYFADNGAILTGEMYIDNIADSTIFRTLYSYRGNVYELIGITDYNLASGGKAKCEFIKLMQTWQKM